MITLKLTSPNMKRPEVSAAQKILSAMGYYTGKIDSIYGEASARATRTAKWEIGYAEKNVNGTFDEVLYNFLTGATKTTFLMKQRVKARAKKNKGEVALAVGLAFVGLSEEPAGSNKIIFSNWYGMIGPWCLMFVTYCFVEAKSKAFIKGSRYAYCPYLLNDAKYNRNGLRLITVKEARRGDLVLFDFKKNGVAAHVGILNSMAANKKKFTSLEGNTSGTNAADGGMVALMTRNVSDVIGFVRVVN